MTSETVDWLNISNKTFIVTGGGRGIGKAIVDTLLASGAKVGVIDKDVEDIETITGRLATQSADITDIKSIEQAAEHFQSTLGLADGLVNCAGLFSPGSISEVDLSEWDRVINTNLKGALICSRTFIQQMLQKGRGSIVHISSIAAHFPQTNSGAYSASKAAILQLSKQIAVEHGANNIRSNAVCPGMIRTPLSEPFYLDDSIRTARESMTASGRIGEPEDIANTVAFLLSNRAEYVNATEIVVDGGFEATPMHLVPRPGYNAK